MVSKTISPNLSPWDFRLEKAPEHVDVEPQAAQSVNENEAGLSLQSHFALTPLVSRRELIPYQDQPCLQDSKIQGDSK